METHFLKTDHFKWHSDSHPAKVSPVQEVTQTLCPVPLDDPLPPALLAELKQEGSELVTGLVDPSKSPVQDVNTWSEKKYTHHIYLKKKTLG